jgi:hypothetical protein
VKIQSLFFTNRHEIWFSVILGALACFHLSVQLRAQSENGDTSAATSLSIAVGPLARPASLKIGSPQGAVLSALKECCDVQQESSGEFAIAGKSSQPGEPIKVYGTVAFKDGKLAYVSKMWCCVGGPGEEPQNSDVDAVRASLSNRKPNRGNDTNNVTKGPEQREVDSQVIERNGGRHGTRTHGLLVANEALFQLS